MGLVEDIQAIRANDALSPAEKRAAVYDLKGNAIVAAYASHVGQTVTRGPFALTLSQAPEYGAGRRLTFRGITVTKNGVPVPLDLPLHLINPPVLVPDGAGGFTLNLLQAVRDAIMDMVR